MADVIEQSRKSVVKVIIPGSGRVTFVSQGSGFVIDVKPDGTTLIMTNNHVVGDATRVRIQLHDNSTVDGTVLGRDRLHDIAIVKIVRPGLVPLELGDVGRVPRNSDVVAFGYPNNASTLQITRGTYSTLQYDTGRDLVYVFGDAAIDHGSSGGPLLSTNGKVIGMVTLGSNLGSPFPRLWAVTANTIKSFLPPLLEGKIVAHRERTPEYALAA